MAEPQSDADLVKALLDVEEGLTGWELDFADSIAKQVEAGRELSDKQREKIEQILERLGK